MLNQKLPPFPQALKNTALRFRWHDTSPERTLHNKIERAILAYIDEYGDQPDWVWVNAQDAGNNPPESVLGVRVYVTSGVLCNHFTLGVDEQPAGGAA